MHNMVFDEAPYREWMARELARDHARVDDILRHPWRHPLRWAWTKTRCRMGLSPLVFKPGEYIVGPIEMITHIDHMTSLVRENHIKELLPVHYFVWARGEPPERSKTKIGGWPYWPKSKQWPRSAKGKPLDFLAQLNLMDSLGVLTTRPPGDLLLLFQDSSGPRAEWVNVDDEPLLELADAESMGLPTSVFDLAPMTGHLCEISEPWAAVRAAQLAAYTDLSKQPWNHPDWISGAFAPNATKIGGWPVWWQEPPESCEHFIACLAPMYLSGHAWSLLNVETPLTSRRYNKLFAKDGSLWDIGSDITIYVYIDRSGNMIVDSQGT